MTMQDDSVQGSISIRDPRINWEAWDEWYDWRRKEKRKKISPRAAKLQQDLLAKYDHETQREIIEQSIMNDWQGLFAPKGNVAKGKVDSTRNRPMLQDLTDRSWAK